MILTVTLNPSLDRTVEVDELVRGAVLRARAAHLDPAGKGVNVTRALLANGCASRAILPVGGPEGDQLIALLAVERVDAVIVGVAGRTRSNITIAETDGTVTKLNEPGPTLTAHDLESVIERVLAEAADADWVAICGSLPPGVTPDQYASMVRRFRAAGLRVALDSSGPALLAAVAAGPDLVKPNAEELAAAVGHSTDSWSEVVGAAQALRSAGAKAVLVSLGAAGAVLVDDDGVLVGCGEAVIPRSTVGAGDASLAGFLAAQATASDGGATRGRRERALVQALAWGTAAVKLPGSRMPRPHEIDTSSVRILTEAELREPLLGVS